MRVKARFYHALIDSTDRGINTERAYQLAKRWTRSEPIDPEAWYALAVSAGNVGETDKELEAYEQCLSLDSSHGEALVNLGGIYCDAESGVNLDTCEAIHAEQNALLQCRDVWEIETCYVTHSPCITCVKLLMNTSCKRIVFSERYAHDEKSMQLWKESGVNKVWLHFII